MTSSPAAIPAPATTSPIPSSRPSNPSSPPVIPAPATTITSPHPTKVALDVTDTSAPTTGPASAALEPKPSAGTGISRMPSPLSPAARPFFPAGRPWELSWAREEDGEEEELECVDYDFTPSPMRSPSPLSYRDTLCRSPTSTLSKVAAIAADGAGVAAEMVCEAAEEKGGRRKRRRPPRRVRRRPPPPPLVAAPRMAGDGRPSGRNMAARLGPIPPAPMPASKSSRRQPQVDADGFQEFVSRSTRRRRRRRREATRPAPFPSRSRVKKKLILLNWARGQCHGRKELVDDDDDDDVWPSAWGHGQSRCPLAHLQAGAMPARVPMEQQRWQVHRGGHRGNWIWRWAT